MSLSLRLTQPLDGLTLDLAFTAPPGITVLFGPSGAGKSTLVNAVAGLMTPQSGRIALHDQLLFDSAARINLPAHRRQLGYVFQDGRLFPHLSVRGNLLYGRRFAMRRPGPALEEIAALLGIDALLERRPGTLSGGEQQRVAIGRALLARPRMLLMDEPLAALDPARKGEILPYLEQLRDQLGLPILYVTHSVDELARLADWVVVLEQGQLRRQGRAQDVLSDPGLVHHFGLREAGAVLPATVQRHHADGLSELTVSGGRLLLPRLPLAQGQRTRVRILAQDVILSRSAPAGLSALNVLPGQVVALRAGGGPGTIVQIRCGDDLLLARITRRSALALGLEPGQQIHAILKSVSVARDSVGAG